MEKVREYIDSQKTDEHRRKYEKTGRYSKKDAADAAKGRLYPAGDYGRPGFYAPFR